MSGNKIESFPFGSTKKIWVIQNLNNSKFVNSVEAWMDIASLVCSILVVTACRWNSIIFATQTLKKRNEKDAYCTQNYLKKFHQAIYYVFPFILQSSILLLTAMVEIVWLNALFQTNLPPYDSIFCHWYDGAKDFVLIRKRLFISSWVWSINQR